MFRPSTTTFRTPSLRVCPRLSRSRPISSGPTLATSSPNSSARAWRTHCLAGIVGGALVIAGGYTWYHFSGIKKTVDASRNIQRYLEETKRSIKARHPNEALQFLRRVAISYVAILPGTSILVDKAFNSVEDIFEAHKAETTAIIMKACEEIKTVLRNEGDSDQDKLEVALKVLDLLRLRLGEILLLGMDVGGDAIAPLIDQFPDAGEKVRESMEQLKTMASGRGSEVVKYVTETQSQVKDMLSKSSGKETVEKARVLINGRISEMRKRLRGEDGPREKPEA